MKAQAPPPAARRVKSATLALIAVVVIIIAVAAGSFVHARRAASSAVVTATPAASPGIFFKSQGHQGHRGENLSYIEHFKYTSNPPTSGAHREIFSTSFINDKSLPKYIQVHLLEHGNILLQYNCFSCPDVVADLTAIAHKFDDRLIPFGQAAAAPADVQNAEEQGQAVIVAPYDAMNAKIAVTAWTRLEVLDRVDQTAIYDFINAYLQNQKNSTQ